MSMTQTLHRRPSQSWHMDITPPNVFPSTSSRSTFRRGLSAAGAAVVVAFIGTAGLGVAQAHAAGVATGLLYAADPGARAAHPRHGAAHPANLPAAATTAYRYLFREGQLLRA